MTTLLKEIMSENVKTCPHCHRKGLILHEHNLTHVIYQCKFCGEVEEKNLFWHELLFIIPTILIIIILIALLIL